MIICHKHKFIFLKTRKTAGTSVEMALSKLCGPGDVVTALNDEEEASRVAEGGRQGGQNVLKPWRSVVSCKSDLRYVAANMRRPELFYNHIPAHKVRNRLSRNIWNNYLKITVERNPWDKAISSYWWGRKNSVSPRTMEEFLKRRIQTKPRSLTNWRIYTRKNRVVADHVLFYEDLQGGLSKLGSELGVEINLPAKHAKGEARKDRRPYQEVLSDEAAGIISDLCWREIEAFGYSY